ncbi:MAG: hypothetical protein ACTSRU_20305, partial [Candidatus Hodarchaeales archaeon]
KKELQTRLDNVFLFNVEKHIHEHTVSASIAALHELGFYSYCETTPVFDEFDKHQTKRDHSKKRGIRDIIALRANERSALIVEVESWKELRQDHLGELLDRIENHRDVPESYVSIEFILILLWDSHKINESLSRYIENRMQKMAKPDRKEGYVKTKLQSIPSFLVSFIVDEEKQVSLQKYRYYSKE